MGTIQTAFALSLILNVLTLRREEKSILTGKEIISKIMKASKFIIYFIKCTSSSMVRVEGTWEEWPDRIWRYEELKVKLCGEKLETNGKHFCP